MAQADYHLKIDGIEGESEQTGYEKQLQIESWSFGATQHGSSVQGSGAGRGKVSVQDFHFVVQNGKGSLPLFLACCKGTHIPNAVLSCRKAGGDGSPYEYLKVTFQDVMISSFQTGGSNGSDLLPMEQISFNFTKITMDYSPQKADGSVAKTNSVVYDVKKGVASGA